MRTYRVEWVMEIDAESAIDAAYEALRTHRDKESIATVFNVREDVAGSPVMQIDLQEGIPGEFVIFEL